MSGTRCAEAKAPKVSLWKGRQIADLPREELLDIIERLARENADLRTDIERWRNASDPIKYMLRELDRNDSSLQRPQESKNSAK